jgi:hypothetical protein
MDGKRVDVEKKLGITRGTSSIDEDVVEDIDIDAGRPHISFMGMIQENQGALNQANGQ